MADSSKTEKATPKKRSDERKKGNIFFSNDAVSVAVLLASFAAIRLTGPNIVKQLESFFRYCMSRIASVGSEELMGMLPELVAQFLLTCVKTAGPIFAVAALVGVGVTLFQTKMLITGEPLKPKWDRLNPIQGFMRLFSLRSVIEAIKGILKITILLFLLYQFITGVVDTLTKYLYTDLVSAGAHFFSTAFQMVMEIMVAYIVLAGADIFYQWWDYERQIKMSKQEIKEEFKQMEGDPQVKGKIKQLQRQMAQSRMMQKVPGADVVIRNPTHFAVALRYKPDQDTAPLVLAKGQDAVALRIVKVAEEAQVAVVENVPLARALYATTEIGQEIPPELYNAVAEVLVYLYRLNQKQT